MKILTSSLYDGDAVFTLFEYGVSTSSGYGVSSSLSNTAYSSQQINTAMTKVIKGEFEKIKDIKVEDDSLACDSPLEVFNCEVSRLSKMDDDLFTYEVEIANIPCDLRVDDDSEHEADDMGFDPSDIAFTEWLGSKFFNYKTMDHYTMKALWIYWIRGDDEVELTDEEFSDNEDEIAKLDSIDDTIVGNLPGTFIIKNQLHYQDYEWYKALEDSELKDEALRNKAIMEGFIKDDDNESSYEQMRRWDIHTNYDDTYKTNHDDNEDKNYVKFTSHWYQDRNAPVFPIFYAGPREGNIDEYWWRIYESRNLEVLES
ncbi:hypothetical protein Tco_1209489 [Tanacetum coccineum]